MISTLGNCQLSSQTIRHFTITSEDTIIKSSYTDIQRKYDAIPSLNYYWYYDNKIHFNQGGYSGKLLNGNYQVFDGTNKLIEKGQFKNGLKFNSWTQWFANGKIKRIQIYKEGNQEGQAKVFNEQGKLLVIENYKNGKLNGKITYFTGDTFNTKRFADGNEIIIKKKSFGKKIVKTKEVQTSPDNTLKSEVTLPKQTHLKKIILKIKTILKFKKQNVQKSNSETPDIKKE